MSTSLITSQIATLSKSLSINADAADLYVVLKATAFRGPVSDAQMSALLVVSNQYGLNPWTKEIYAFPDKNNGIVPVVGVDGWSRIINSHPQFDGMEFCEEADWTECVIFRKDRSHPIKIREYMGECKRDTAPWKSHPRRMLRHKAMIQCSRLAFGFVGIYDPDEAERILDSTAIHGEFTPVGGTNRPGVKAIQATIPEDSPERIAAITDLTAAAKRGTVAFREAWANVTKDTRDLVRDKVDTFKSLADAADEGRSAEAEAELSGAEEQP